MDKDIVVSPAKSKIEARNAIVILTLKEDHLNYYELLSLDDPKLVSQALQINKEFQKALLPVGNSLKFDVLLAKEIISNNPKVGVIGFTDLVLEQSSNTISSMVERVLTLLKNVIHVPLKNVTEKVLRVAIQNTFANLHKQEKDEWIFWEKTETNKTTYQYNMLFTFQSSETGNFLYSIAMGVEVSINLEKGKVLCLTLNDKERYNVRLQALSTIEYINQEQFISRNIQPIFGIQINSDKAAKQLIKTIREREPIRVV
ncbi:cytolytic delta-endotoxin (insecticidal protein) [Photobacterium leiognathi]|nr:cytolytic delta-endotoxin (insecticidal protein) [Photobacterium leiognathi]